VSTPRKLAKNSPIAILYPVNDTDQHIYNVLRQHANRYGNQIVNIAEGKDLIHCQELENLQGIGVLLKGTKLNGDHVEKLVNLFKHKHILQKISLRFNPA
jgi:hypothetical protein